MRRQQKCIASEEASVTRRCGRGGIVDEEALVTRRHWRQGGGGNKEADKDAGEESPASRRWQVGVGEEALARRRR